jgi:hypothetical protein
MVLMALATPAMAGPLLRLPGVTAPAKRPRTAPPPPPPAARFPPRAESPPATERPPENQPPPQRN